MKPSTHFAAACFTFALLALLVTHAPAQTFTGTITGTVNDTTGAVVPKAKVRITQTELSATTEVETNELGVYVAPSLRAGPYTVEVQATGFRPLLRKDLVLHVNERLDVSATLQPGGATEVVEVTGTPPAIQTQSADVSHVVEARRIVELPLDGRRYVDLILLSPGAVPAAGVTSNPREGRINVDGNFSLQNNFVMNGVDNNSFSENAQEKSPQAVRPTPDAIREFKVQTRTYTADFGWAAGAVVNAEIKSGSNELHGSGWWFYRNDNLNAINYFAKRVTPVVKPPELRHQYGFTVGGPLIKDKTFWFFDYEHKHSFKGTTAAGTVPTVDMKTNGIFPANRPASQQLRIPAAIPQIAPCIDVANQRLNMNAVRTDGKACIDPAGLALARLYPDPNAPSLGATSFIASPIVPDNGNSFDVRVDHKFNEKNIFYAVYDYYDNEAVSERGPFPNPLATGGFSANFFARGQLASATYIHTFNQNLLNDFRAGFNRVFANSQPLAPAGDAGPQFGLKNLPGNFAFGLPPINVSGYSKLGTSEWRPQYQTSQVYQFLDSLSYLRGEHSFKFGFEFKRIINNFLDIQSPNGQININNVYTGDGIADLMLGLVSSVGATPPIVPHNYLNGWMGYAQDNWKITPKLTMDLGVRYEYFTPWIERNRLVSNFDPTANGGRGALVTAAKSFTAPTCPATLPNCLVQVTGDDLFSRTLIHPDHNNFAPRWGFAYHPIERLVVRGGYGVFYQAVDRNGSSALIQLNPPHFVNFTFASVTSSQPPQLLLRDGFPSLPTSFNPATTTIQGQGMNNRTPYSQQYSFGPQVQLTRDVSLEVAYVGGVGRKLRKLYQLNQGRITGPATVTFPFPDFRPGGIGDFLLTSGTSNYNSLQVQVRKQFSHGLAANFSYTWGKALGDVTDNLSTGTTSSQLRPQDINNPRADYGPLNFDQKHRAVFNWVYELPFGPGKTYLSTGPLAKVLGDWQFNGIYSYTTGVPITITAPDSSNTFSGNPRANCIGDPLPAGFPQGVDAFFDKNAFARPAPFTFGNCPVGSLYGWPHSNFDLSLFKKVRVDEKRQFEFRSEFFNAFNTPQFNNPSNSVTSSTFGRTTSVLDPDKPARVIQMGLKFYW